MKVLIIGLGSIAAKHIAALRRIDYAIEIYALRSSRSSVGHDGITNLYSYDDISGITFDFIIIANPTSEHDRTIHKLLEFNIPLFIEKPLSHAKVDIALIKQLQSQSLLTYVACNMRFLDCLKYVKEHVRGRINEINVYCGSYLPQWRPNIDFRKNYSAIPELGGGVHLDLIHELDYIYWMFGEPLSVSKLLSNHSSLEIESVDYANYILEYNGFSASVILNYFRRDAKRSFEIIFDDRTWYVDLLTNTVYCNGDIIYNSDQADLDTYIEQMSYFMMLVKNKETMSFNTVGDANNVLNICLGYE